MVSVHDALITPLADLRRFGAAVELDGPEDVAAAARTVLSLARPAHEALLWCRWHVGLYESRSVGEITASEIAVYVSQFEEAHGAMETALDAFTAAARHHFNNIA
ncbi:hypothetical protein AB0O76_02655 [Streptomyces sp. NPDC086554]|uniref:hypothetical protein n=1 Tax=Streptomyces sp. NPDC086554 TaxID=3154864 RepID=UPI00342ECD24